MVSGIEFLHGDDWEEDYDPYWMYRIEGLDPFENYEPGQEANIATTVTPGDGLASLTSGYLTIFPELDLRLGMTYHELSQRWQDTLDVRFSGNLANAGNLDFDDWGLMFERLTSPSDAGIVEPFMIDGLFDTVFTGMILRLEPDNRPPPDEGYEHFIQHPEPRPRAGVDPLEVETTSIVHAIQLSTSQWEFISPAETHAIMDRLVEIYGEPFYSGNFRVTWNVDGYFLLVTFGSPTTSRVTITYWYWGHQ